MEVKHDGPERFAEWVDSSGMSRAEIGRRLGVSGTAIHWWIAEVNTPSEPLKREIQRLTKGKVKASAWRVVDRRKQAKSA